MDIDQAVEIREDDDVPVVALTFQEGDALGDADRATQVESAVPEGEA